MKKNIYENLYSAQDSLDLSHCQRLAIMLDMVNCRDFANRKILDIGCHDGAFLSRIKNRNNEFYGIEAADFAVDKAREKGIKVEKFFFDDTSALPFADGFFDLIVAGEIIEHIYDTDFFLSEIKRLLKIDGYLLISTPNIASLGRRLMLLLGFNPIIEVSPNEKGSCGHIRYFTFKTLRGILEKHGFILIAGRSDVVNFSGGGRLKSSFLADIFPALGQSVIYFCQRKA